MAEIQTLQSKWHSATDPSIATVYLNLFFLSNSNTLRLFSAHPTFQNIVPETYLQCEVDF